jgi:acyl phosphate:glycerol-3-phosphate acyltransferase
MQTLIGVGVLVLSYVIGSIPFGLIIVRLTTGKDIRQVESRRTGGTNAMRAGGFWVGLGTAIFDILKGTATVWLAQSIAPGNIWLRVLAPVGGIVGHNYSVFLIERQANGRLRFRGGAGGATCLGGSIGLWWPSALIILPVGAAILYFIGYASLATLSAGLISTLIFIIRAYMGLSPWEYPLYGILAFALLAWALRPNIQRLLKGTERMVGLRARHTEHTAKSG